MIRRTFFCSLCVLYWILNGPLAAGQNHVCPFSLQGEFLYLKPTTNSTSFATEVISSSAIKSLLNSPKYRPGFRIEAMYHWDCRNSLHGRFTYFNSGKNSRSVTSTFLSPIPFVGTVTDVVKFRYYAAELLFGRWLINHCDFDLELQAGILYSNIKFNDHVTVSGPTTPVRSGFSQSKFWGVGPEFVLDFNYPFPFFNLAFAFDCRGALLISKTDVFVFGVDGFNLLAEPFFGVVPASDLRLGLHWGCPYRCFNLNLELGYEWIYYHRAFIQSSVSENISFQGPYAALGVTF